MSEKNELFLYFIPNRRRKSPFRRSPSDFDNFWIGFSEFMFPILFSARFSAAEKPEFNIVDTLFIFSIFSICSLVFACLRYFSDIGGENTVFDFRV